MGQQQLLLLVLGIVIVGLAVVAGINAFQENNEKSQKDALVNEAMRVATDVQAYRLKPDELGGGGGDTWPGGLSAAGFKDTTSTGAYNTPWGTIDYDGSTDPATLTLNPTSSAETATIDIPVDGNPNISSDFGEGTSTSTG